VEVLVTVDVAAVDAGAVAVFAAAGWAKSLATWFPEAHGLDLGLAKALAGIDDVL
jgi:hypothetical protein